MYSRKYSRYFRKCTPGSTVQGRRKLFHSGGAALKGEHLCILIAKWGTWVNIQKISSILTTDAKIHHFIHATEANKMADLAAIVSFWQNQKLQTF